MKKKMYLATVLVDRNECEYTTVCELLFDDELRAKEELDKHFGHVKYVKELPVAQ